MAGIGLCLMLLLAGNAPPPSASVEVQLSGARSARGVIRLCLTANRAHFLHCERDPAARSLTLPASASTAEISGLAAGTYALAVLHDENGNGRLDTMLGIPREGFGFSRNPAIRMGPPRWEEVRFDLSNGAIRQPVRLRYLL